MQSNHIIKCSIDSLSSKYLLTIIKKFGLSLNNNTKQQSYLIFNNNYLYYKHKNYKTPIYFNFTDGKLIYRQSHLQHELLAKAIDYKKNKVIWDATAGAGIDAFILASLGLEVYLFERNTIVAVLLYDALSRAKLDNKISNIIKKMLLVYGSIQDNKDLKKPDVIYFDPMFPSKKKSAATKKILNILQEIVGKDDDAITFFNYAKTITKKIVVKRPIKSQYLNNEKPSFQYFGKTIRYDIYII